MCNRRNCSRFAHPHQPIPKQQILRRTPSVAPPPSPSYLLVPPPCGRSGRRTRRRRRERRRWEARGALLGLSRGSLWALLGRCWGPLGALWKGLGGLWGLSWRQSIKIEASTFWCPPVGARKVASWGPLGPLLGRSWALLGPSWASLGPVLGLSWAILGPS